MTTWWPTGPTYLACSGWPDGMAGSEERSPDQLTRRASLTFLGTLLRNGARGGTQLLVLPIVVRGLGAELYGAWAVIQQAVGYLVLADLRSTGTLKFTLAVRQHVDDVEEKRRQIGTAIVVWLATLPLLIAVGAVAVAVVPSLLDVDPDRFGTVRVALVLAFATLALDRLLSLPAHVLRGMNLDYKASGLDAATFVLTGVLGAVAVEAGWGLVGLAGSGLVGITITNVLRFVVAKRALPWLGVARPSRQGVRDFSGLSGWLLLGDVSFVLVMSTELILVGVVLGATEAALYATTGAVVRLAANPMAELLASGGPGMALLAGREEWDRVVLVRAELYRIAVGMTTVLGAVLLVLNQSFVHLWIGPRFYAGDDLNALLVVGAVASVLYRSDGVVTDAMLEFRSRAVVALGLGVLGVAAGALLLRAWGMEGMAVAAAAVRLLLCAYVPVLVARRTGRTFASLLRDVARPVAAAAAVMAVAFAVGRDVHVDTWLALVPAAAVVGVVAGGAWWYAGLVSSERTALLQRLRPGTRAAA